MMDNHSFEERPPTSRGPRIFLVIFAGFALLFGGYYASTVFPPGGGSALSAEETVSGAVFADLPIRGRPDAVVTIEEFSDFQCYYCAQSVPTLKRLMEAYPGQIRWIFRHFPVAGSHPNAPLIHLVSMAAGRQGRFWEMHDLVFENRDQVSMEHLVGYAQSLELDMTAFQDTLQDRALMARIKADFDEGINRGVRATPTFFLNGRKIEGAVPYPLFEREVELALARIRQALPGTSADSPS